MIVAKRFDTKCLKGGVDALPERTREIYRQLYSFGFDDTGNAEAFRLLYGGVARYRRVNDAWYFWNGNYWQRRHDSMAERLMKQVTKHRERAWNLYHESADGDDSREKLPKFFSASRNQTRLSAALKIAKTMQGIEWSQDIPLDPNPDLFCAKNSVVDLRTGQRRRGRQDDYITRSAGVEFDPTAQCPRWERFLEELFPDAPEVIAFLQRLVGYTLTGWTSEQCFVFLIGDGANGKSVFTEVIRSVLGNYATETPFSTFERKRSDAVPNDIAALAGARFVSASESEEGRRLSEAKVKRMTGGDSVSSRFLYQEYFTYVPVCKFVMSLNHFPEVIGTDDGIWRRLLVIPFEQSFLGREDKHLKEKLIAEAPGILAWAVRGCLEWQKNGLMVPERIRITLEELRSESDLLGLFLEEAVLVDASSTTRAIELFKAFKSWCLERGHREWSNKLFGTRLKERGYVCSRDARGRFYQGLQLRRAFSPGI